MASITKTVEIAAPPERVWSVLVDLDRLDEWVGAHRGFPDGAPPQLRAGVT